jgi:hypothetical protein
VASTAWSRVKNEYYWEAGNYHCKLSVETGNPRKKFEFSWRFSLSEREVSSLSLNVIGMMEAARGVPQITYNFAHPLIEDFK